LRLPPGNGLDLPMGTCTDSTLLDVAGALEALPELALEGAAQQLLKTGRP